MDLQSGVTALAMSPLFTTVAVGTSSGGVAVCPAWMSFALDAAEAAAAAAAAESSSAAAAESAAAAALAGAYTRSHFSSTGAPLSTV